MKKGEKRAPAVSIGASGLEFRSLGELREFAQMCVDAEAVPKGMNAAAAAVAIQAGLERGLGPLGGLRGSLVVNGQIAWRGEAAAALIRNSAACVPGTYFQGVEGEGDAMVGYAVAQRVGYEHPTRRTFTVVDAKRAGLWATPGPWRDYPQRQLMWRAVGFLGKDVFSDVLGGFPIAEEAMDFKAEAPRGRSMVVAPAVPPPAAAPSGPDALLAMIEEAPAAVEPQPVPAPPSQVETLKASIVELGGVPESDSPADEPGVDEAAELFAPTVKNSLPVPYPVDAPPEESAEIPPPAVTADSISELKAKLAASIAPIEARTKLGCDHPSITPKRIAAAAARKKTLVCTDCGEELQPEPAA